MNLRRIMGVSRVSPMFLFFRKTHQLATYSEHGRDARDTSDARELQRCFACDNLFVSGEACNNEQHDLPSHLFGDRLPVHVQFRIRCRH